jgi:uncharacterized protein YlaI
MQCYKCGETDTTKLSLKKQQRGIMTFICRSCRNTASRIWLSTAKPKPKRKTYTDIDPQRWATEAKESRRRIAANYIKRVQHASE